MKFNTRTVHFAMKDSAWFRGIMLLLMLTLALGTVGATAWVQNGFQFPTFPLFRIPSFPSLLSSLLGAPLPGINASCKPPSVFTPLSKCEDDAGNVTVGEGATNAGCGAGQTVVANQASYSLKKVTINNGGIIALFDETAGLPVKISTTGIRVAGTLQIGNAECPIGTNNPRTTVTIQFTGDRPTCPTGGCGGDTKGIEVENGGTLRMYGLKGVPDPAVPASKQLSWTYLSQPGGPSKYIGENGTAEKVQVPVPVGGDTTLHLAYDVSDPKRGWKQGDWIAVATTSFDPFETEFVQLITDPVKDSISGGSTVNLGQPLKYYHFGSLPPTAGTGACKDSKHPDLPSSYCDGADRNYGIDERAEVALITRNIRLTADTSATGASNHWGGELRFIKGYKEVSIQGVELQKFGKEQLGSYPIHFHMAGSLGKDSGTGGTLIDSNSIDHSYNKCITMHMTDNAVIGNNVCARITGHIFYEETSEEFNNTFDRNLGMGAMSNSFDINTTAESSRDSLIQKYYWTGDYLAQTKDFNFDQFRIFDTDNQFQDEIAAGIPRVRGSCGSFNSQGKLVLDRPFDANHKVCGSKLGDVYFEPPSGFWISNPSTKLTNNSIAGCQDVGKAYWYVPTTDSRENAVKFIPIGEQYKSADGTKYGLFQNNRGHGCYSGVYGEDDGLVTSDELFGYKNAVHNATNQAAMDEFDNVTLSRIRDRGVWLRPTFFYLNSARVATTRDGVSLVTSGGVDGNYPGVFGLLQDSVIAGMSSNNVDRWGPCGSKVLTSGLRVRGADWGCIDQTLPSSGTAAGGEYTDRGYPTPDWPMFGFLIYDGPPLMVHDRFVNFRVAPGSTSPTGFTAANLLTATDDCILKGCPSSTPPIPAWIFYGIPGCPNNPPAYSTYEGDAALGWFNVNQSSYPAATTTKEISFTNVDLRHQIYTQEVNRGGFSDGDENTTILDLDGTLSDTLAMDTDGNVLPSISLNNLGINASTNSVDECLSVGAEDAALENRPTSAMVPTAIGQLEFEMLYPPTPQPDTNPLNALAHKELLTFTKNTIDFSRLANVAHHQSMPLESRNGLGDWEPKVTSGYGYTVTAGTFPDPTRSCKPVPPTDLPGINPIVDLTLTDIVNAHVVNSDHPFYVQLGICYTDADGVHPDPSKVGGDLFKIVKGYRSYGGGNVVPNDSLKPYWGGPLACNNLDNQLAIQNGDKPTDTKTMPKQCPSVSSTGSPITTLTAVDSYSKLTADGTSNGKPNLNNYFYDQKNGWLFLWVAQTEPAAKGPSPLGNCTGGSGDPAFCPSKTTGDSYYVCPAQGCPSYRITLNDTSYKPGASKCGDPYTQGYEWANPPANENTLVRASDKTVIVQNQEPGRNVNGQYPYPHYTSNTPLSCKTTTP